MSTIYDKKVKKTPENPTGIEHIDPYLMDLSKVQTDGGEVYFKVTEEGSLTQGDGTVLEGFVVIGVVIVVGYLLGRSGVLGPTAVDVLSRLAFFVASPALLFVTLAGADVHAVFSEALLVTAVSSSVACLLYVPVGLLRNAPKARRPRSPIPSNTSCARRIRSSAASKSLIRSMLPL